MESDPICFSALKLNVTKSIPPTTYAGNHGGYILHHLNIDRITTQTYCDVLIYADRVVFPVHKCIVGMFSNFHGTLKPNLAVPPIFQQKMLVIHTNGISQSTMGSLLNFIYTAVIVITKENVYNILNASHFLSIIKLNELCIDYLIKHGLEITFANCVRKPEDKKENLSIVAVITPINSPTQSTNEKLQKTTMPVCSKKITKTSKSMQEKPMEIRSNSSPHISLNLEVIRAFSRIKAKAKNNSERMFKEMAFQVYKNKCDDFCSLFAELNLNELSQEFICQSVITKEFIINCERCRELVAPFLPIECPFPNKSIDFKIDSAYELILIGGGFGYEKSVQKYNVINKQWIDLPDLPGGHYGSTAEKLDHYIYLMGGEHYYDFVFRLDLHDSNKKWERFNSLNMGRECAASTVLNDCIYVVGGRNKTGIAMSFGEFCDPNKGEWIDIPSMNVCRSGLSLVEVKGKLYAIGGLDENKNELSSVECFDPSNNKWTNVSSMTSPRYRVSSVAYNNMIYVTGGGLCKGSPMNKVEIYDTVGDLWEIVSPMHQPREYHCMCMINHTLYVVGGARSMSIEIYDSKKDHWKVEKEKIGPRFGSALVVI